MIDQAITRTFPFLDITIPNPHLEYSIVRSRYLVAHNLTSLKLVDHWLDVRANVSIFFKKALVDYV